MELLIFDVSSRMAHFRKIYSTSTSLSYFFPPRTTITGLIAGLLGIDRDSYYDEFSPNNCRIAVRILSPLRKLVQFVNYLNLDEISELKLRGLGKDGRVPTSIELVVPEPSHESVTYRIFVHSAKLMKELEERLDNRKFAYPPCLGAAYCLAEVSPCDPLRQEAHLTDAPQSPIEISTVIKESKIASFPQGVRVCRESRVPISFSSGRKPELIDDYICQLKDAPIKIQLRGRIFSCEGLSVGTYGTFME